MDPFRESAKRAIQAQNAEKAFTDQIMNTFPGVACTQSVTGHGQGMAADGRQINVVIVMFMTQAGPIKLVLEPDFANRLATDLQSHSVQAKSGIEIVQNGHQ